MLAPDEAVGKARNDLSDRPLAAHNRFRRHDRDKPDSRTVAPADALSPAEFSDTTRSAPALDWRAPSDGHADARRARSSGMTRVIEERRQPCFITSAGPGWLSS